MRVVGRGTSFGPLAPPVDVREKKQRRSMSASAAHAVVAARRAIASAGWTDLDDVGLFMAVGPSTGDLSQLGNIVERGVHACSPLYAFELMNNFTLAHPAIALGLGGPSGAFFAPGDPTFAFEEAIAAIEAGRCTRALVGWADVPSHPLSTWRSASHPDGAVLMAIEGVAIPDAEPNDIVISGMGVVSAFGAGGRALHQGLLAGRSAASPIHRFDGHGLLAAQVDGAFGEDRKVGLLLAAAEQLAIPDGTRVHIGLGLEVAKMDALPTGLDSGFRNTERGLFRSEVDTAAQALRDRHALGRITIDVSACAAGGLAIGRAADLVRRGEPAVLTGAADSMVNPLGLGGMHRLGATSPTTCRPFDVRADGLLMGEGAALFLVEREARALAAGRPVLARITGWGSSMDGYRPTAPRPDGSGAERAMRAAVRGRAIDWVNAHGTGTPRNDPAEMAAIRRVVGDAVPVSSLKGALGHAMAAAGALEAAATVLALQHQVAYGTAGLESPRFEGVLKRFERRPLRRVVSNSFGFGGQNVALVLESPHDG